jgi:hypothetical protein
MRADEQVLAEIRHLEHNIEQHRRIARAKARDLQKVSAIEQRLRELHARLRELRRKLPRA